MPLPSHKHDMVEAICRDISLGIWDEGPCEKCGAKSDGSCCGCSREFVYQESLTPYKEVLGEDALIEAIAVGKLKHQIATTQKVLEKRQKRLEKFLSPEYEEMKKKQAEVTAYFSDIKKD